MQDGEQSGAQIKRLMACAPDAADALTQALGGVLARFGIHGLRAGDKERLLSRYFPAAVPWMTREAVGDQGGCAALRAEEFDDLLALLLEHRSDDTEEIRWLACAIATACMGDNHLWQDMGLPNRDALSALLKSRFTTLHAKNTGNMKWKKFFYKQLCERAAVNVCKAPSCKVCVDYMQCFGPEEV